ncbi:hypothetical protein EVA_08410 [gut metagenome]|uniref:Uncharacterized protein n=1 Tax=gut metagenome TaxID=749906 RepID=J9G9D9_9ZZZZ
MTRFHTFMFFLLRSECHPAAKRLCRIDLSFLLYLAAFYKTIQNIVLFIYFFV